MILFSRYLASHLQTEPEERTVAAEQGVPFELKVRVKNTGKRTGQETVQLYVSDKKASLPRPVKELKGFQKVTLAPGEEKEVSFIVTREALSFFDDRKHAWVAEPGTFEALIGASATDIRGRVAFTLKTDD